MPRFPGGETWRTTPSSDVIFDPSDHQPTRRQSGTRPRGAVTATSRGPPRRLGVWEQRPLSGQTPSREPPSLWSEAGSTGTQSNQGSSRTIRGPDPPVPTPHAPDRWASSRTIAAAVGEPPSDGGPWAPEVRTRGRATDEDGASDGRVAEGDDWPST